MNLSPESSLVMDNVSPTLLQTRRHFFRDCSIGLGSMALASLLRGQEPKPQLTPASSPLTSRQPHFPAKARSVIFLFMAGGPSQLELFDYKPRLQELNGKPIPDSYLRNKRFAFMDSFTKEVPKLLGTRRKFACHGQSGTWVSECLPHTAGIVDDLAIVRSVATKVFNHAPAKIFIN